MLQNIWNKNLIGIIVSKPTVLIVWQNEKKYSHKMYKSIVYFI